MNAIRPINGVDVTSGVDGETCGTVKQPGPFAACAPFAKERSGRVKLLDATVAVRYINAAGVDGEGARSVELSIAEFEGAGAVRIHTTAAGREVALRAPLSEKGTGGIELLNSVVVSVRDIHIPGRVGSDGARALELSVAEIEGAAAVRIHTTDAVWETA